MNNDKKLITVYLIRTLRTHTRLGTSSRSSAWHMWPAGLQCRIMFVTRASGGNVAYYKHMAGRGQERVTPRHTVRSFVAWRDYTWVGLRGITRRAIVARGCQARSSFCCCRNCVWERMPGTARHEKQSMRGGRLQGERDEWKWNI